MHLKQQIHHGLKIKRYQCVELSQLMQDIELLISLLIDLIKQQKMFKWKVICLMEALSLILMHKILKYSVTMLQLKVISLMKKEVVDCLKENKWTDSIDQIKKVTMWWWIPWIMAKFQTSSIQSRIELLEVTQDKWECHIKTWAWAKSIWSLIIWLEQDH